MPSTKPIVRWTRRCLDGAVALLLAVCLLTMVLARIVPMTGRSTFVVAGGSMAPAIGVGSAVIVDPAAPASLVVGDIVSLRSGPGNAIFTHRVTRVVQRDGVTWVQTRGDANAEADPSLTPASNIIGRVSVALPFAGYLVALQSSLRGTVFVTSLGLLLLLASWVLRSHGSPRRGDVAERAARDEPSMGAADPV